MTSIYYIAYSTMNTLTLLEESKGTNWSLLRTRSVRIRTISQIPMKAKIPCHQAVPIYKVLAPKIKELKALGLYTERIATTLKINKKTVRKAISHEILDCL